MGLIVLFVMALVVIVLGGVIARLAAAPAAPPADPAVPPAPVSSGTASPGASPSPEAPPAAPADWLSGVGTEEVDNGSSPAAYFADWRGSDVEIGQTWVNTPDVWGIQPWIENAWGGFTGPMSISFSPGEAGKDWISGGGERLQGWRSWAATAQGDMDDWWRAAARETARLRADRDTTYVSPFYEYNGDWMFWSVERTPQGLADFRDGWARVAAIWREEFPEVQIVLPAGCTRDLPEEMLPDPASYDVMGCTMYNSSPWSPEGNMAMLRLESARQFAELHGKPFAITEWANVGNPATPGGGGEAPGYIASMHAWLQAHGGTGPGQVVFECFFNIDGYERDHILYRRSEGMSTTQPETAATYQELW
ncbi:MAG TPA: hypothetical protein PKE40_02565 [Arachnia sp.]|nr:hypothetical protein [Arachnia sp.]HMT85213.1 hypothetical protein [Arachnia sp.]